MSTGHPLVATSVVPRQPGHQLLRVATVEVGEEGDGLGAAEGGCPSAVVHDHDLVAPLFVDESVGSTGHRISLASRRRPYVAPRRRTGPYSGADSGRM